MKPSNELFDLIKSLNKSEKRYFKLQTSLQSGSKNYVRLFDCIDKMGEYNEEVVKKTFAGEKFVRHLPSEKNHLYKLILRALRAFHGENSISSILKQEIKNIEILYNKALFSECNKFLTRAKRMAIEYEKFYYLFELINWEKTLLEESFEDGQFTKDLDALIREEQEVIEKLRNLAAYHVLYSKINYVFRSGGFSRTDENRAIVDEIVNHPLIKEKNTALSKRAATICYYTQGFCNMANGDSATALVKFQRVKEILDGAPELRTDLAKRYIRTLGSIVSCLNDLGRYAESREVIATMRAFTDSDLEGFGSTDVQVSIFKAAAIGELELCHRTGEFEKGLKDVEEILKNLSEYEGKLHKEQEVILYYYFGYIYFGSGQYNKALFWINKILNDNENTLRQDIYSYARLFNLAIHYELGNFDLLEYVIKSTTRYLEKRQRNFPLETLVLQWFKKLIRANNPSTRRELFVQFRDELKSVSNQPENEVVLNYFNFINWAESKLNNDSFEAVLKKSGHAQHLIHTAGLN